MVEESHGRVRELNGLSCKSGRLLMDTHFSKRGKRRKISTHRLSRQCYIGEDVHWAEKEGKSGGQRQRYILEADSKQLESSSSLAGECHGDCGSVRI